MEPSAPWRRRSRSPHCSPSSPSARWYGRAPRGVESMNRLGSTNNDQAFEFGDDRRRGVDADALDQRLGEIRKKVMQIAQVLRPLQSHHEQVAAKAELRVDGIRELALGRHEAL